MALVPPCFKRTRLFGRILRAALHTVPPRSDIRSSPVGDWVASLVAPGKVVFDVGANYGARVHAFLAMGATVVAVEPQRDCQRALSRWFRQESRVHLVRAALGETPGTTAIHISNFPTLSSCNPEWISALQKSQRFAQSRWSGTEKVPVTTLDLLIERFGPPAFIKIDVEGFELPVIRGLSRPVPALSLECASESVSAILACLDHLERIGHFTGNFSWGEEGRWVFPDRQAPADLRRFLTREVASSPQQFGDLYLRFAPDTLPQP